MIMTGGARIRLCPLGCTGVDRGPGIATGCVMAKRKSGGMVAGHDYNTRWPGVIRAVNERFTGFAIAQDSVWVHFKK